MKRFNKVRAAKVKGTSVSLFGWLYELKKAGINLIV
jgi:hypothetical protein